MKPKHKIKKLSLNRTTIATLTAADLKAVQGGLPPQNGGHTHSVCADQCCDTDQFTNCASRVGICW